MGGKAFAQCGLPVVVPRLPPELYRSIRDQCLSRLSTIYRRIASPTAAPGKSSHGDIDILAAAPIIPAILAYLDHQGLTKCCLDLPDYVHAAKHLLDAHYLIYTASNPIISFAIPHPSGALDNFVQVDITFCPEATFDWQRCMNSHGDFWLVVSRTCMPYGLSFTDSGVHLRDKLIQKYEWSKKFLVCADPNLILDFLNLDCKTFWQDEGFRSKEEMFEFLSSMRLFDRQRFMATEDRALNSSERKKVASRDDYRLFCEEYVPKLVDPESLPEETREEVQQELMVRTGKQQAWDEHRAAWWQRFWKLRAKQVVNIVRRDIKQTIAMEDEAYRVAWTVLLAQQCEL